MNQADMTTMDSGNIGSYENFYTNPMYLSCGEASNQLMNINETNLQVQETDPSDELEYTQL